ncbi:PTS sugar transporter subunit IIB [Companilactobacillus bobalius]|uniref:Protein-N(Pi)-phosphohistidine--sugar phosphotransferase n=2 Tax=Companilactobacillus bobalius TaxID=2801451 RepID=A0A202FDG2_9LACO|nr:PTS sugar transporter subunit IIB [Companilactobacillus bobalius]KAE9556836.1 PTS galactitol transporter subunit IIB [Companilactobacillus bobalius]OVE98478.1 Protein-N(pi)-phosphohistidine--sugar phosphotransferase [Companilactobacillus bobalius]GEO58857.1 PTS galactitol transporter subunit IIB [Companilactobacillus paralimentarius]
MAKSLMVVCGTGIATSTVATGKIKSYLEEQGLSSEVHFLQSKIADEVSAIGNDEYDIVVSTTMVPSSIKDKVINGVPLLTGIGADKVFEEIKSKIEA